MYERNNYGLPAAAGDYSHHGTRHASRTCIREESFFGQRTGTVRHGACPATVRPEKDRLGLRMRNERTRSFCTRVLTLTRACVYISS